MAQKYRVDELYLSCLSERFNILLMTSFVDLGSSSALIYKSGIQVASLVFNVASTNNLNWFPQNKLVQSPWSDLKAATNLETFNIDGVARYFDISPQIRFWSIWPCDQNRIWGLMSK